MVTERPIRLLITGGGTGGHLFPAVAAAQALRKRQPESEVLFVGTRRKIDTTSLKQYGFSSSSIISYGLKGKNIVELLKALATLPVSILQAANIIRKFRPDIALGVGGYVTGPVMVAAKLLGIPTVIHEQNSVPGLANRKLGSVVDKVCLSLPGSNTYFDSEKITFTGNPVRENILELREGEKSTPSERDELTLLVLGGSQGAHMVNEIVSKALCLLKEKGECRYKVIHQTGNQDEQMVRKRYSDCGIEATVAAFFQDMKAVYKEADLLVSRAGATTLTELAVLGKPAILVPYPFAADNHQKKNGLYYVEGGGALQFDEKDLSPEELAELLADLEKNRSEIDRMATAMRTLGKPDAADAIIDICLETVKKRSDRGLRN